MDLKKSKKHFPDWLFYIISVALVGILFLYMGDREKKVALNKENQSLKSELLILRDTVRNNDSAKVEANKQNEASANDFKKLLSKQDQLKIENYGDDSIFIRDFRVVYYDTLTKSFKHLRGLIENEIAPNQTCSPRLFNQSNSEIIWNGEVLFYSLTAKQVKSLNGEDDFDYFEPSTQIAYYFGVWDKNKVVRININEPSNLDESRASKFIKYCK